MSDTPSKRLRELRDEQQHYVCEDDCWFTCPLHPESCNTEAAKECNCDYELRVEWLDDIAAQVEALEAERDEALNRALSRERERNIAQVGQGKADEAFRIASDAMQKAVAHYGEMATDRDTLAAALRAVVARCGLARATDGTDKLAVGMNRERAAILQLPSVIAARELIEGAPPLANEGGGE